MELLRQRLEQRHGHQLQLGHDVQRLVGAAGQAQRHARHHADREDSREAETAQLLQTARRKHLHGGQRGEHGAVGGGRWELQELKERVEARGQEEGSVLVVLGERVEEKDCA